MRADICEPSDGEALGRFRRALIALGAELLGDHDSSLDVRLLEFRIGAEVLHVFADAWSVDIEGAPGLVQRVLAAMAQRRPES
jgi:hypothetical protein